MTYTITEPCVGVKDAACIAVCPVDCIIALDEDKLVFIHPDECIDCGACVPECPVNAIFPEDEVPADQQDWIPVNREYFTLDRTDFLAKFGALIERGMEQNRGTEHVNADLYGTPVR